MTHPFDVPGYVQGFRFKNDPLFYDSSTKTFRDLAGYGPSNDLTITAGTPAFQTPTGSGGNEGMLLDNQAQGAFLLSIPWEGTLLAVLKPSMGSNGTIYPAIFGAQSSATSNGTLRIVRVTAADYRYRLATYSGTQSADLQAGSDATQVAIYSLSQESRTVRRSFDAVTVTETTASADDNAGNRLSLSYQTGPTFAGHKARFGNLSGTIGDTAESTNTCTIFELHFWSSIALVDHLAAMEDLATDLRTKYGIA